MWLAFDVGTSGVKATGRGCSRRRRGSDRDRAHWPDVRLNPAERVGEPLRPGYPL